MEIVKQKSEGKPEGGQNVFVVIESAKVFLDRLFLNVGDKVPLAATPTWYRYEH